MNVYYCPTTGINNIHISHSTETMSELYCINEVHEGRFQIKFDLIDYYKRRQSFLTKNLNEKNIKRCFSW